MPLGEIIFVIVVLVGMFVPLFLAATGRLDRFSTQLVFPTRPEKYNDEVDG